MQDPPTLYYNPDKRFSKSQQALQQALTINEIADRTVIAVQDTESLKKRNMVPPWLTQSPMLAMIVYRDDRPQLALFPPNSVMEKLKAIALTVAQQSVLGESNKGERLTAGSAGLGGRSAQVGSIDDLHAMGHDRSAPLGPSVALGGARPKVSDVPDNNIHYRRLEGCGELDCSKVGQASLSSRAMATGDARDIQSMLRAHASAPF